MRGHFAAINSRVLHTEGHVTVRVGGTSSEFS